MTFEVLTVILFLNVIATISLWRAAARKPDKLKEKFLSKLRDSKPISPKHRPPKNIGDTVPREDRLFFADFRDFADVVNWWLGDEHVGGPWRLQELPDTELSLSLGDSHPSFGRRYDIFYNQVPVGTLEVSPVWRYKSQEPVVRTEVNIDWMRLLSYDAIQNFLHGIALHVCNADHDTNEYLQTCIGIDRALTRTLWQTQTIMQSDLDGQSYGELDLQLEGSAQWYVERRKALRNHQAAA